MRDGVEASYGWLGLLTYVVGVDFFLIFTKRRSLSWVFADALLHPIKRFPVIGIWSMLTIHLFVPLLPKVFRKLDVLRFLFNDRNDILSA